MWAAVRRDHLPDHAIRLVGMIGFAMPPFWIGLVLMLFFGLKLDWFPIAGFGEGFFGHLYHLFLPALTMALFLAPILIQSLRSSMLDVWSADYIEVARAKGLTPRRILLQARAAQCADSRHHRARGQCRLAAVAARSSSRPCSPSTASARYWCVRSAFATIRSIQGLALVFAVIVMAVNLLADLAYMLIDRRVAKG